MFFLIYFVIFSSTHACVDILTRDGINYQIQSVGHYSMINVNSPGYYLADHDQYSFTLNFPHDVVTEVSGVYVCLTQTIDQTFVVVVDSPNYKFSHLDGCKLSKNVDTCFPHVISDSFVPPPFVTLYVSEACEVTTYCQSLPTTSIKYQTPIDAYVSRIINDWHFACSMHYKLYRKYLVHNSTWLDHTCRFSPSTQIPTTPVPSVYHTLTLYSCDYFEFTESLFREYLPSIGSSTVRIYRNKRHNTHSVVTDIALLYIVNQKIDYFDSYDGTLKRKTPDDAFEHIYSIFLNIDIFVTIVFEMDPVFLRRHFECHRPNHDAFDRPIDSSLPVYTHTNHDCPISTFTGDALYDLDSQDHKHYDKNFYLYLHYNNSNHLAAYINVTQTPDEIQFIIVSRHSRVENIPGGIKVQTYLTDYLLIETATRISKFLFYCNVLPPNYVIENGFTVNNQFLDICPPTIQVIFFSAPNDGQRNVTIYSAIVNHIIFTDEILNVTVINQTFYFSYLHNNLYISFPYDFSYTSISFNYVTPELHDVLLNYTFVHCPETTTITKPMSTVTTEFKYPIHIYHSDSGVHLMSYYMVIFIVFLTCNI